MVLDLMHTKIYKLKAKDSEINAAPLFLGSASKGSLWKRLDYMGVFMIFLSIMIVLMLLIF